MNILLIGSGGREHTIAWKISQSPQLQRLFCIPGNGGIREIAACHDIPLTDFPALADFVRANNIDLTVVGPEQPLVEGLVDYFEAEGLAVFGPNKAAARIEGSKVFSKKLMADYNIPTAAYREFDDPEAALAYINNQPEGPLVVKADGLAAGKGALVCPDKAAALAAVDLMMKQRAFQSAGDRIIIEEFMRGEEVSIFVICDGQDYVALTPAQDFKRVGDGDSGKNTGGMGCYAPSIYFNEPLHRQTIKTIIEPTLNALKSEGIEYRGVLYCGLMLTAEGPRVVEFNCRFGDPETQVVLPLLKTDLLEIMTAVAERRLKDVEIEFYNDWAVCVILASGGYPDSYPKGKVIHGLKQLPADALVFHAGTQYRDGRIVTSGGRVMGVCCKAPELQEALQQVYQAVSKIDFEGMHYRKDIARRALNDLRRDQQDGEVM